MRPVTPIAPGAIEWDLLLRGAVAGLLGFHLVQLALPGPRPAARAALGLFTLSVLAYLFCQRVDLMLALPPLLTWLVFALCVSSSAWLWLAARALFDDGFAWTWATAAAGLGLAGWGLAVHGPRLASAAQLMPDPLASAGAFGFAAAALLFVVAALWEVLHGWHTDLVEPRRAARRWVAGGIGAYAAIVLLVELALRGRAPGPWLPALHVAAIGGISLGLASVIARRSLDHVLGVAETQPRHAETPLAVAPAAATPVTEPKAKPQLTRLQRAMTEDKLYHQDGLTLAALAQTLGLGEAALRALINHELGYRNFNDFLHHYRLTEAAARLRAESLPILTIALDCGYGSIGPFNRAFKQRFGMTPTEYRVGGRLLARQSTI